MPTHYYYTYFLSMDTDANVYVSWSKFSTAIYQEVSTKLDLGAVPNSAKAVYFPKKMLLTIESEFTDRIFWMHRDIQKLLPKIWSKYMNWPLLTILTLSLCICAFEKRLKVRDFSSSQGLMLHGTVWLFCRFILANIYWILLKSCILFIFWLGFWDPFARHPQIPNYS